MMRGSSGGLPIAIDAAYGMAKDGTRVGRRSKRQQQGTDFGLRVGALFTFHVRVKGDTLALSDPGPAQSAGARQPSEGDYQGAAQKK